MQNKNPGDIISGALDVRDRIRTHDLLVRSQTLYPAELHVHFIYRFSPATVCIVTAAGENVNRIFQFFQTILSAACFSVACTTFTSYFSRMACLNSSDKMILNRFDLQTAAAVGKRRSYYADYHKRAGKCHYPFHCHDDGSVRSCATVSESRCTVRAGEFPGHGHFHGQHDPVIRCQRHLSFRGPHR